MSEPVEETVFFKITVRSFDLGDHWVAKTLETGVYTYGETRDEAELRNGEANELLIRRWKLEGLQALGGYLTEREVEFAIGGGPLPASTDSQTAFGGAAAKTEIARAA